LGIGFSTISFILPDNSDFYPLSSSQFWIIPATLLNISGKKGFNSFSEKIISEQFLSNFQQGLFNETDVRP